MLRLIFYVTTDNKLTTTPVIGATIQARGFLTIDGDELKTETYLRHMSGEGPDIGAHLDASTLQALARHHLGTGFSNMVGFDTAPIARNVEVVEFKPGSGKFMQRVSLAGQVLAD